MEVVQLGRSPVSVSRVIFGAKALGPARRDQKRRIETIHAALDSGVTTIDTAPVYDFGLCERLVGKAIAEHKSGTQVFTKVGLRWDDPHGELLFATEDEHGEPRAVRRNSRPDSIRLEVERSLSRLRVDVLDTVYVQKLDRDTPIAETMGALIDLLGEGKLRAIGISSDFGPAELKEAQRALGDVPLAAIELRYSLLHRRGEEEMLPLSHDRRIAVVAHTVLERGLLAGKLTPASLFGTDDPRGHSTQFHPDNVRRIVIALQRGIAPVATRHGASIAQVVLAWALAQQAVSAVTVGSSWPEQARANTDATQLVLDQGELLSIQRLFEQLHIDPYAGLTTTERMRERGRPFMAALRRSWPRAPAEPIGPAVRLR